MSTFLIRVNDGPENLTADDVADAIYAWDADRGGMDRSQIDVQRINVTDLDDAMAEVLRYRIEDVA